MGNHVISDLALGVVDHHSDIPVVLAAKGYISADLKEEWIRMIGFRNILVHDYLDIDLRIVYDALRNRLSTIEALQRVFAQFL